MNLTPFVEQVRIKELRKSASRVRCFQNLVAAEVTRLKQSKDQSLLTSAATVLKKARVQVIEAHRRDRFWRLFYFFACSFSNPKYSRA